jgi:hypothetical protein
MNAIYTPLPIKKVFLFGLLHISLLSAYSQPDYTFTNPVLQSAPATDLQVGAIYRFNTVKTGVDALVTIISMSGGITLSSIDETWTGFDEAFQPFIKVDPLADGYVEFQIDFINPGNGNPKIQVEVPATCIDVDGVDYGDGYLYEKDQIQKLNGYYDFSTIGGNLSVIDMGGPGAWVVGENISGWSYSGIDTTQKDVMFTVVNANISSFNIRIGARNTSPTGSEVRYRSVYFKKFIYPFSVLASSNLLSFKGNSRADNINLDWSLAAANTVTGIELQRSYTGNDFKTIATFNNNVNGISKTQFSYADLQTAAMVYYRLKLETASGKIEYSTVLSFKNNGSQPNTIKVYPTVVTGGQFSLSFNSETKEESLLQMLDYAGRIVYQKRIQPGQGNNTILINDFNTSLKGNFIVVTKTGKQTRSAKIIIQ